MKKLFIAIALLAIIWTVVTWKRQLNFPNFKYDHVALLSLDRNIEDTASYEFIDEVLMPYDEYGEQTFVDSNGIPLHNHYIKTDISRDLEKEISRCLVTPGMLEGLYSYKCIPAYRDVIVYYDKNEKPIQWISVCFECKSIALSRRYLYVSDKSVDCLEKIFSAYKNRK